MHILDQVQVNFIYNTNHNLFLWIEIFISTMDLYNTTANRWSTWAIFEGGGRLRGNVRTSSIARWKAVYDFLFVTIELFSLALTVDALQGKTCQDSLLSGEGRSLGAKISGGRGHTFCYLTVHTLPCYVPSFSHNTGVWQAERGTDGRKCHS